MLIVPSWPAPTRVRAVCSTRQGGVSQGPYESLNLGDHVGDEPAHVASNRRTFALELGARPVYLKQVHGLDTIDIDYGVPDGTQADACVTTVPGMACTIMMADCLPVLLCNGAGTAVAAAHAGWRGLAGFDGRGVVESVFERFIDAAQMHPSHAASKTIAWLGPCIGPDAFEVGPDVKAAFEAGPGNASAYFVASGDGKWKADLQGLARTRLRELGITRIYGNDGSTSWCTVSNPSVFFSHRRDRISGRMAASIWLT